MKISLAAALIGAAGIFTLVPYWGLAGATNITLLGFNMRDGLRLKGRLRRAPA